MHHPSHLELHIEVDGGPEVVEGDKLVPGDGGGYYNGEENTHVYSMTSELHKVQRYFFKTLEEAFTLPQNPNQHLGNEYI